MDSESNCFMLRSAWPKLAKPRVGVGEDHTMAEASKSNALLWNGMGRITIRKMQPDLFSKNPQR